MMPILPIKITTAYSEGISESAIRELLIENNNCIIIDVPLRSIGSTNSYLDIIEDYLEASYLAEELGELAERFSCRQINNRYSRDCRFEIVARDVERLANRIYRLAFILSDEQEEEDVLATHSDQLRDYESTLEIRSFVCPDLVDDYYANLVNGAYYEMQGETDEDFLAREYERYPERRFGFWKSAYSNFLGGVFYASSSCLIMPRDFDLNSILKNYLKMEVGDPIDSSLFTIGSASYLANSETLVRFRPEDLATARKCTAVLPNPHQMDGDMNGQALWVDDLTEYVRDNPAIYVHREHPIRYQTTGSVIVVEEGDWIFLLFSEALKSDTAVKLFEQLSPIVSYVATYAGIGIDISLPWENLDDSSFEDLCYDILYHDPKFDNRTIRKMGKTRSRDGGRDIEITTHGRPGYPPKKFIFQCKMTKPGSSLTLQKVRSISDTIIQYGANGYGLMTNVVIDAGLYDRIGAICGRFGVEDDHWSILEIERFISQHPNLRERHFRRHIG